MSDTVVVVGDVLGRAIARRFAREGFVAALVARSADLLERIANEIRIAKRAQSRNAHHPPV